MTHQTPLIKLTPLSLYNKNIKTPNLINSIHKPEQHDVTTHSILHIHIHPIRSSSWHFHSIFMIR